MTGAKSVLKLPMMGNVPVENATAAAAAAKSNVPVAAAAACGICLALHKYPSGITGRKEHIVSTKCRVCYDKEDGDGSLCPICSDFGLIESIAESVVFLDLYHSDPDQDTGNPPARQRIEHLHKENAALRKEINDLQQSVDRWQGLVLALCCPNERQAELMDEMNTLLVKFLSGPWKN